MDASSNPNPNEPNPPTPTDPIIIPDEPTLPTESQPIPSNTKQFKELTSKVWEHFTKLGGGNPEEPRATCNYCKKPYKCHSRQNGTLTLWGHVRNCKKNPKNKNNDKSQPTIAYHYKKAVVEEENDTKEIEVHQFSIKKIRLALARMIIVDELPFRFVEHEVPNHKGETIGKVVEKYLKEWGIDIVLTITVDNASSNDVAIDYLRRKMKLKESCIVGCEFLHMRCYAHILNLIVQDGLKDIHESIAKVRNAVQYAKSSPKRWNSTYLMLEAAEKFERAFDRLIIDDEQYMDYFEEPDRNGKKPKGPPRSLDWENARLLSCGYSK
uniref:BED-type domain-containing protein n=1 Tax=Fagus sylvatica TaxID=28930 RepID=A0A2N9HI87_FAGSY